MSEDASVNTGAVAWPEHEWAQVTVRRMQTKLHCWAVGVPGRRFDDLYNLVCDPAFLVVAWQRVAGNKGSRTPGVDRATVAWIASRIGVEEFLNGVREQLRARTFCPVEVRQVEIPKSSGKVRRLGIPTVTDRVVQAALKLVLEPIFEADFAPCSYGFRPNRRAQDAIAEIHHFTTKSYHWVLEADIEACFDNIDHVALLDRVRARIGDKRVTRLVKSFLKAGVMTTTGSREATHTGTPQGGILSPLLANIALSTLDDHFITAWNEQMGTEVQRQRRKRQGRPNFRLVRYADDFVVLVTGQREHAEQLQAEVAGVLAPMGLRLSPEKTRVVHIDDGFDFLGFNIRRMRRRGSNKWFVYTRPSKKAIASIKARVKAMTYRATLHHDPGYLFEYLGRVLRGWANYFRHGVSKATFSAVDSYAWERITAWLRDKHKIGWPELRRRFCLPGTWRLAVDGQRLRGAASVPVVRYRYRGYRIPTPWTPTATTG
ncbi:group II intron reverse transcriptase/maturase [Micrococcus terreus]|uniref:group II intron reverse transcriptase/maturase n=1 Tax=Micrococcus terreus TaxID=574650 RepID=UPI002551551E|nr:group II intron reverse transcriptase/maturase [Micrococcus terreus]MDK7702521.1 group II intron reverse transcriptase/maturase [Micrococcus terreus]WOO98668.1 group II intron reverse transcriptase/maturase [Micrococcus terreus]